MKKPPATLRPVRPNVGLQLAVQRRLLCLIDEMHNSFLYWLRASYRKNPPVLAADELPATTLKRALRDLQRQWQHRFDGAAPALAKYFGTAIEKRTKLMLQKMLKEQGFSVQFKMTRGARDVLNATITQNVGLIRSIPQKYLADVEGAVMRSVQTGRDLKTLTDELEASYAVTRKRAAFIARDQNNKATAAITRGRQQELGIRKAIWMHSGGGKVPRPSHVKAGRDKVEYDTAVGWYDPHEEKLIFPGELINCRCVSRSLVPGFA